MRGRIVVGIILLIVGITSALSYSGILLFPGGWSAWWPSLLILIGLAKLAIPPRSWFFGSILVGVGAVLQAWRLGVVPGLPWAYAAPLALIALGLALIGGAIARRRRRFGWHEM